MISIMSVTVTTFMRMIKKIPKQMMRYILHRTICWFSINIIVFMALFSFSMNVLNVDVLIILCNEVIWRAIHLIIIRKRFNPS